MSHIQTTVLSTADSSEALQAERLKLRIAELDLVYTAEVGRLDALLQSLKRQFTLSEVQGA
jgi:hypothetical protein